ncbi:hypothetical protein ACFQV2_18130 [Actinokineospora soli]|uniref:BON domain-containing protein n=1 Tax=Actinokineospora soli TaxID=1048753 RepID=A0ABW2TQR1_9PSEU
MRLTTRLLIPPNSLAVDATALCQAIRAQATPTDRLQTLRVRAGSDAVHVIACTIAESQEQADRIVTALCLRTVENTPSLRDWHIVEKDGK